MHLFYPFESIKRVATFALKRELTVEIPLGGKKPVNIRVRYLRIILFKEPYLTLQSVPDKDPEMEADGIIEATVLKGFHNLTIEDVTSAGGIDKIEASVTNDVVNHPTLQKWGVLVTLFEIMDIEYPNSILAASDEVIRAQGKADAEDIQAEGRKKAMDRIGPEAYLKLEWYEALQHSNITTLVTLGEMVEDVVKFFKK